ncbi:MAG: RNA polymerase sigma-70 factor [Porphyromonadaceae bacterium]|nr:MAG: RNA polymerase sigma-70 factor [Porphyromonadaceae bacterium]
MLEEKYLLEELRRGNKAAFTLLFHKYYKDLVIFGGNFLHDKGRCEDIVQDIFLKLWTNHEEFEIDSSLKSFMLRSVQNSCLDELRHRKVVREHESYSEWVDFTDNNDTENYILYSDLKSSLDEALNKLPEVCREAFQMNRFEGLKYKEIAERLNVSERTIEVRIGKAIGLLRHYLKAFFVTFIALLWS